VRDIEAQSVDLNLDNLSDQRYFTATNVVGAYVRSPLAAYVTVHADF
jgi:iron complex outermembrane receptor protein